MSREQLDAPSWPAEGRRHDGCWFRGAWVSDTCSVRDAVLIARALEAPMPEACYTEVAIPAASIALPAETENDT